MPIDSEESEKVKAHLRVCLEVGRRVLELAAAVKACDDSRTFGSVKCSLLSESGSLDVYHLLLTSDPKIAAAMIAGGRASAEGDGGSHFPVPFKPNTGAMN